MRDLLERLRKSESYRLILDDLRSKRHAAAEELWGSSSAMLVSALAEDKGGVCLCVLPGVDEAERFAEDVRAFQPERLCYFPAWEKFDPDEEPDVEIASERLFLIRQLLNPRAGDGGGRIIVAPVAAVLQLTPSAESVDEHTIILKAGDTQDPDELARMLGEQGFHPTPRVEAPGEFCRKGGILDVFPFAAQTPLRIEFFGDEVDSLREFDPATQDSLQIVERCEITTPTIFGSSDKSRRASIFDHMPDDAWVALKEPPEIADRADAPEVSLETGGAGSPELLAACRRFPTLEIRQIPGGDAVGHSFGVQSLARFTGQLQTALNELKELCERNERIVVLCNNEAEQRRLEELLEDSSIADSLGFETRIGRLNTGFEIPDLRLAVIPHHELFNRYQQRRALPRLRHTGLIESTEQLSEGDPVVHVNHGLGIFRGMRMIEQDGKKQECLYLEYANGTMLYVPIGKMDLVQKYIGPSEGRPELDTLGGKSWRNRKLRAAEAADELAVEMLQIQVARETEKGIRYNENSEWIKEFEAEFFFEETEDQLIAAENVQRDMERERPMDRLICGDVGYGKTEVAMRAAFRAVMNGKQVAVLVPTTILAAQHYRTFTERMADYPVRIEMLSRFRTKAEQKRTLERMAEGTVDIVIGTHRIVQKDVQFKELGLVVIDEEQRFGVAHKERLKRLRATVDVLTLTATPIPRTLHMALLGLRDISTLSTPPRDRLAIQTRPMRFSPEAIRKAVLHEMARDGQVFFLHNRVMDIADIAAKVREIVPEARILIAHGQMGERQLEQRMKQFVAGEADVLVCTTIIQTGLDIPNVNTIIINDAQNFGLADLHQLRGRVGRYKHRAYAYLLIPKNRPIRPDGQKRLQAIQEFAELGAGFKIAMRDLEIRGAGNLLGREQHGHIAAVGYDMYCKLLEQAIRRRRGEKPVEVESTTISLGLECYIPRDYMPDGGNRLETYRNLARATTEKELDEMRDRLRDRYGPPPEELSRLVSEARLRIRARRVGIRSIHFDGEYINLRAANADIARAALMCPPEDSVKIDELTVLLRLHSRKHLPPQGLMAYLLSILPKDEQE